MQSYRFKQLSILFILSILLLEAGCNNSQVREFNQPNIIVVDSQYAATPKAKAIQPQKGEKQSQEDIIMIEAVAISNDFYNNLLVQNYPAANKYMHEDALSVTSKSEWIKIFQFAQTKTGKLGFVKQIDHGVRCNMNGGNGLGDYAELIFDTQYKDGNLREKLTFFRKDSTEKISILGYEYHQIVENIKLSEELK
jgi:hypothetical protein